jgi:hypothetical protein
MDTGCGHDLIDKKSVATVKDRVSPALQKVGLQTASGFTKAESQVEVFIEELGETAVPYVLPSTPPVLSIGRRCVEQGYSFFWKNGELPYFVTPDKKKIVLAVQGNIPYLLAGTVALPAVGDDPPEVEVFIEWKIFYKLRMLTIRILQQTLHFSKRN